MIELCFWRQKQTSVARLGGRLKPISSTCSHYPQNVKSSSYSFSSLMPIPDYALAIGYVIGATSDESIFFHHHDLRNQTSRPITSQQFFLPHDTSLSLKSSIATIRLHSLAPPFDPTVWPHHLIPTNHFRHRHCVPSHIKGMVGGNRIYLRIVESSMLI